MLREDWTWNAFDVSPLAIAHPVVDASDLLASLNATTSVTNIRWDLSRRVADRRAPCAAARHWRWRRCRCTLKELRTWPNLNLGEDLGVPANQPVSGGWRHCVFDMDPDEQIRARRDTA